MDVSTSEQAPVTARLPQDGNPNEDDGVERLESVEMEIGPEGMDLEDVDPYRVDMESVPQSPASSIFLDDTTHPPSPDVTSSDFEQYEVHAPDSASKWKHSNDPNAEEKLPHRMNKRKRAAEAEIGMDDDSCEERGESRSAVASRKLKDSLKSGQFVVDERKKTVFEEKCRQMGGGARFRYEGKWEVLHLKCGKWSTMTEPYNTTRFKSHLETCKSKGAKGHNGCIDDFFRPRTGPARIGVSVKNMKQLSTTARRQVVVGGRSANADLETPPVIMESLPCLGLREEHNGRIPKYISRVLTEGAGSRSDSHITAKLFGNGVKYSQLGEKGKQLVQAAQVHSRTWIINRELQVIYSTNCRKTINRTSTESTCPECLSVLRLETFKKALSVEAAPLVSKKYIPRRWRTAATDLAVNLAEIHGLPGLLEAVGLSSLTVYPSAIG